MDYLELKHAQHQQFVFELKMQLKKVMPLIIVFMCKYSTNVKVL